MHTLNIHSQCILSIYTLNIHSQCSLNTYSLPNEGSAYTFEVHHWVNHSTKRTLLEVSIESIECIDALKLISSKLEWWLRHWWAQYYMRVTSLTRFWRLDWNIARRPCTLVIPFTSHPSLVHLLVSSRARLLKRISTIEIPQLWNTTSP